MPALPAPAPLPLPVASPTAPALDPADPRADERLAPVLELVEAGAIGALSLDFFDTLCGRAAPSPVLVFRRVGEVLRAAGLLPRSLDPAAFVHVRALAEARARRRRPGRTEIELRDVYAEIPENLLRPERRADAAALEVKVEAELIVVDPAVLALARRARERGIRVAIVSDTYLSAADLRFLLRAAGGNLVVDHVLTSSAAGRCKADGLLEVLLARLRIRPDRVAHLGDDLAADVLPARRAGIRAFHHAPPGDLLRRAMAREMGIGLREEGPDGALAFLRNRASHRGAAVPEGLRDHFRIGAAVLGPVLAGFADWVADTLEARRCGGAVFLMREGDFLAQLVGRALTGRAERRHLATLWVSRHAAFRAGIDAGDEAELRSALARRTRPTAAEFCAALGVTLAELGLPLDLAGERLEGEAVVRRVIDACLAPAPRARIRGEARRQRALLVAHFAAAVPFPGPVGFVDLGWGATIQRLVVRALRVEGREREVFGLYLAATARAAEAILDGSDAQGWLASPGRYDRVGELIARSPEVLEQVCLAPVGSTIAYERGRGGRVEPVLEPRAPDPRGDAERAAVRAGIFQFQAEHLALARGRFGPVGPDVARAILARFLASPSPEEARLLGGWRHDDNFGSTDSAPIAPPLPARAVARPPPEIFDDRSLYWPAASAARTDPAASDGVAAYALLGLFGPGSPPGAAPEAPPLRHRLADGLDQALRRYLPEAWMSIRRALLRSRHLSDPPGTPLRYQLVDELNEVLKRTAPAAHARAKQAAAAALEGARRAEGRLLALAAPFWWRLR